MSAYVPRFKPGEAVTFTAAEAVTGGRLVEVAGDRAVQPAGAGSTKVAGVAAVDSVQGEHVLVWTIVGGVHRLVASGTITAGDRVTVAEGGKVSSSTEESVGLALTGAGNDETVEVLFA